MAQVVVLDFDGVIVDSNRLKREAFFNLFPRTEETESVIEGALAQEGPKSRFDILREILRALGESNGTLEERVSACAERYNEEVQRGIAGMGLSPGVREALGTISRAYCLYLSSGTYEPALRESVDKLKIGGFFRAVYGGPVVKADVLRKIMAAEKVTGREVVIIGDGKEDCQSALECGCRFIGVANEFNRWQDESFPLVPDLKSAVALIESPGSGNLHGSEGQNHRRGIHR